MTDTPKPPMVVWIGPNQLQPDMENTGSERGHYYWPKQTQAHRGPYVHLDQFMAEVERRAGECSEEGLSFDPEFVDAARELSKELKEQ